jgi:drug/metabolite transporter (DMT)-like permease
LSHRNAILIQALAAVMFSTSGLFIKLVTIHPLALAGARSLIAAVIVAGYIHWRQGQIRFDWSLPQVGGALALVGAQIFFVLANRQTTAANAVFIQYTAPIYVALFGIWFLKEPAYRRDWLTMAAIGVGLYLFFGTQLSPQDLLGSINALISGICLAWFVLFLRKLKDGATLETVLLGNLLASLIGLPFLWGQSPTLGDWGGILFLGIFQLGLPFVLMTIAIRYLTAVDAILIQTLEPVLNPIWVFLVIGEVPSQTALLGGGIVLVAVTVRSLLANRAYRRQRLYRPSPP